MVVVTPRGAAAAEVLAPFVAVAVVTPPGFVAPAAAVPVAAAPVPVADVERHAGLPSVSRTRGRRKVLRMMNLMSVAIIRNDRVT
jgi:hypothetical protein